MDDPTLLIQWFEAAKRGHSSVLIKLLRLGVAIEATLLDLLEQNPDYDTSFLGLKAYGVDFYQHEDQKHMTALCVAAENGRTKCVDVLLSRGATAISESNPCPPLTMAAYKGHLDCVALLLPHGIPCFGTHALELSAERGHDNIVKMILDYISLKKVNITRQSEQ